MEPTRDIAKEFSDLGIDVQISAEVAEAQWKKFAREYRVVGLKADGLAGIKAAMISAIMAGDAEIGEDARGVFIKQFVARPQSGGPKELIYNPPSVVHVARGGTDDVALAQKWLRYAASSSGKNEGELSVWLVGRDYSLMETIAQLFTSV
jgi:hypothetical protein